MGFPRLAAVLQPSHSSECHSAGDVLPLVKHRAELTQGIVAGHRSRNLLTALSTAQASVWLQGQWKAVQLCCVHNRKGQSPHVSSLRDLLAYTSLKKNIFEKAS